MSAAHGRMFLPHGAISFILLLALISFCLVPHKTLRDPATALQIATGDVIRELGRLPEKDPSWTFNADDTPWVHMTWVWHVMASWLHEQGGIELVVSSHIALGALTVTLLAWSCLLRGAGVIATLATLMGGLALFTQSSPRPHCFSHLFIVLFHIALYAHHANKLQGRWLWGLPLLLILWANIHAAFFVAYTLLGIYGLMALIERDWKKFRLLTLVGIACLLGMFVTPRGFGILGLGESLANSPMMEIISKWKAFAPSADLIPIMLYMLGVFWLINPLRKGTHPAEMLLIYFWIAAALVSRRHLNVFMLISAPALAVALHRLLMVSPMFTMAETTYMRFLGAPKTRLGLAALALLMLVFTQGGLLRLMHSKKLDFAESIRPEKEIAFILAHYPDARFMTYFDFAGYIVYATRGKLKVFVDGRGESVYPIEVVKDYVTFHTMRPGADKVLDKYRIDGLLLPKPKGDAPEDESRFPDFEHVYSGEAAQVFIRKKKP